MSYVIFGFNSNPPSEPHGGWGDWKGTVLTMDAVVTRLQQLHAFHTVQVIDMRFDTEVAVPRPLLPTCAHGVPQVWSEELSEWRAGRCAPCVVSEQGNPAIASVPGTTPGPSVRLR